MQNVNAKRNDYLDIIKAITIVFVVMGHSIQYGSGANFYNNSLYFSNCLFIFIYSFHMPLFMMISGYLFYYSIVNHTTKYNIKSRISTLLIPIMIWTIPQLILVIKSEKQRLSLFTLIKTYWSLLITNLWFLWAILLCSFFVMIVNKLFNDSIFVYIICFAITFLVSDVYSSALYKYMYPFFLIGYFFNMNSAKHKNLFFSKLKSNPLIICVTGIIFFALLLFYNKDSFIYTSGYCIYNKSNYFTQFIIDMYRFFVGLAGSIFIIVLIYHIYNKLPKFIINKLAFVGKNSLGIYILSGYIFIYILPKITNSLSDINYGFMFLETIVITFVTLIVTILIKKIKFLDKLLLGGR